MIVYRLPSYSKKKSSQVDILGLPGIPRELGWYFTHDAHRLLRQLPRPWPRRWQWGSGSQRTPLNWKKTRLLAKNSCSFEKKHLAYFCHHKSESKGSKSLTVLSGLLRGQREQTNSHIIFALWRETNIN